MLSVMGIEFKYRGRVVTDADVVFIRELISQNPAASRWALSKLLCEAWNWVQPNGTLKDMVCRGLMLGLHRGGHIELPPVRQVTLNPLAKRGKPRWVDVEANPLEGRLSDFQPFGPRQLLSGLATIILRVCSLSVAPSPRGEGTLCIKSLLPVRSGVPVFGRG